MLIRLNINEQSMNVRAAFFAVTSFIYWFIGSALFEFACAVN